jgi:hypothetical protein
MRGGWIDLSRDGPLDLDRSSGRDHSRRHDRCDVRGRRSEGGGPDAGGAARGQYAAAGSAGRRSAATSHPDQPRQRRERAERGSHRRQLAADAPKLGAVLPASRAVVQVTAGKAAGANASIVGSGQLGADLVAGRVTRLERGSEAEPGPHEQRFHGGYGEAQHASNFRIGHAAHLAHQQRRALLVR